ncbi:hypothetical protein M5D96_008344 [Drosophila gunungcola]|uniref:Uncharacterized protein n=1 Tax=Drosophila gunungcola TaxID=103775 RepID=A0A9P9YKB8_9MUSC|nr:hypothetical protein M5D96_008344 [Drosophila gunungcola]
MPSRHPAPPHPPHHPPRAALHPRHPQQQRRDQDHQDRRTNRTRPHCTAICQPLRQPQLSSHASRWPVAELTPPPHPRQQLRRPVAAVRTWWPRDHPLHRPPHPPLPRESITIITTTTRTRAAAVVAAAVPRATSPLWWLN